MSKNLYDNTTIKKIGETKFANLHIFNLLKKYYINDFTSNRFIIDISTRHSQDYNIFTCLNKENYNNLNNNFKNVIKKILNYDNKDFINLIKSNDIIKYLYNVHNLNENLLSSNIVD